MGVYTNIQAALDTKLNTIASSPSIAWPNTAFEITHGTTYLEPILVSIDSELHTLNGYKRYSGIYQVNISVPLEKGTSALNALVDEVSTLFSSDRELLSGGDRVLVQNISRGPAIRYTEDRVEFYRTNVDINFIVYS